MLPGCVSARFFPPLLALPCFRAVDKIHRRVKRIYKTRGQLLGFVGVGFNVNAYQVPGTSFQAVGETDGVVSRGY